MKTKFLLVLAALMVSATAFAQNWETGPFVGGGIGFNAGLTGAHYETRRDSHFGAGLNLNLTVGYWFHPRVGVRAGYNGLNISTTFTDFGAKPLTYLHADLLFRICPSLVPYVSLGGLGIDRWTLEGGGGICFPVQMSRRVSLVPDLRFVTQNPLSFSENNPTISFVLSGSLGVMVKLGKVK